MDSNNIQIQSKGFYHLQNPNTGGLKGNTLASLLLQAFDKILNQFKKGLAEKTGQARDMAKLIRDVAKLTTLINEVSNPNISLDSLETELQAQVALVGKDIGALKDSPAKVALQKSLANVMALFKDKTQFKAIANWYKDLQALEKLLEAGAKSGGIRGILGGNPKKLVALLSKLAQDQGTIAAMVNALNALPPALKGQFPKGFFAQMNNWFKGVTVMWTKIGEINVTDPGFFSSTHTSFNEIILAIANGNTKGALSLASNLYNKNYAIFNNYKAAFKAVDGYVKEKRPDLTLNLKAKLIILRLMFIDKTGTWKGAFAQLYSEYTDATGALNRINIQSSTVSEQYTTSFYQALQTIAAIEKQFSALETVPIGLVNKEIANITR